MFIGHLHSFCELPVHVLCSVLWLCCLLFLFDLQAEFTLDKNPLPFVDAINIYLSFCHLPLNFVTESFVFSFIYVLFQVLWSVYTVPNLGLVLFLAGFISRYGEWDNFPIILKFLYSCCVGMPLIFGCGFYSLFFLRK